MPICASPLAPPPARVTPIRVLGVPEDCADAKFKIDAMQTVKTSDIGLN